MAEHVINPDLNGKVALVTGGGAVLWPQTHAFFLSTGRAWSAGP
jgi:hypothetical protein